jgi:hypothetical protein
MMKTGEAFAAFIDWDLTELLKGGRVSADDVYLCVRELEDLVTAQSKVSVPDRIDWIMDAHRIVWFRTGRPEHDLVASIFTFFNRLLIATRNYRAEAREKGLPPVSFRAGIGAGKVAMHMMDKNVFFGDGLEDASACSKVARQTSSLLIANAVVLQSVPLSIAGTLCHVNGGGNNTEKVSINEQQLAVIAAAS